MYQIQKVWKTNMINDVLSEKMASLTFRGAAKFGKAKKRTSEVPDRLANTKHLSRCSEPLAP